MKQISVPYTNNLMERLMDGRNSETSEEQVDALERNRPGWKTC